jgi:hypothetical protein
VAQEHDVGKRHNCADVAHATAEKQTRFDLTERTADARLSGGGGGADAGERAARFALLEETRDVQVLRHRARTLPALSSRQSRLICTRRPLPR